MVTKSTPVKVWDIRDFRKGTSTKIESLTGFVSRDEALEMAWSLNKFSGGPHFFVREREIDGSEKPEKGQEL